MVRQLLTFILFVYFLTPQVNASLWKFTGGVKSLTINSLKQTIPSNNIIHFEGDVEVLVGSRMHIWADRVHFDKHKKILIAQCDKGGAVKIEDRDFVVLADALELDFNKKVGSADNIRIHVQEGFVSAKRAEKLGQHEWQLTGMVFTACDDDNPHWSLRARKATMHGGYFIRVSDVVFKVGQMPILYLPKMAFPIQSNTRTGFLIPKFYIDYDYGFGYKQEYYMKFANRCDAAVGVDWRRKKGVFFSGEFRWGRSPWCFTNFNAQYALARKSFIQKGNRVVHGTKHRYWISGKDYQSWENLFGSDVDSLVSIDFGTDKRIGYQFSNSLNEVDDSFYNAWIMRLTRPSSQTQFLVDNVTTSRKRFSDLNDNNREQVQNFTQQVQALGDVIAPQVSSVWQKKALENRVSITQLPHLEWNSMHLFSKGDLYFQQTAFLDRVLLREQETEKLYFHSLLAQEEKIIPLSTADLVRANYSASFGSFISRYDHSLNLEMSPMVQLCNLTKHKAARQNSVLERQLFARGAARLFVDFNAVWALPQTFVSSRDWQYSHFFQPVIEWKYTPMFEQKHWYQVDQRDTIFAQNSCSVGFRNNWQIHDVNLHLHATQGYDFFDRRHIHPLRRGLGHRHLMPLDVEFGLQNKFLQLSCQQEYDVTKFRLLHSLVQTQFKVKDIEARVSYLFQHRKILQERELLSNVPHFLFLDVTIPLGKKMKFGYGGHFYSETGERFLGFMSIKPLLHSVRFEYNGHCWGCYLGYEEKRYREFGNNKHERAIVFSLRLDALGSFAKKFKRPDIIVDPEGV